MPDVCSAGKLIGATAHSWNLELKKRCAPGVCGVSSRNCAISLTIHPAEPRHFKQRTRYQRAEDGLWAVRGNLLSRGGIVGPCHNETSERFAAVDTMRKPLFVLFEGLHTSLLLSSLFAWISQARQQAMPERAGGLQKPDSSA